MRLKSIEAIAVLLGTLPLLFACTDSKTAKPVVDAGLVLNYDGCEEVSCWDPPDNTCGEVGVMLYSPFGNCVEGECRYAGRDVACEDGACEDGSCELSPCQDNLCNDPPANKCADAKTSQVYTPFGNCNDGECRCDSRDIACESGLSVTGLSARSVELTWLAATDPDGEVVGYNVYFSVDSGETYTLHETTTELVSTMTDMLAATTYWLVVRSIDDQGEESEDSAIRLFTTDNDSPTAPANVTEGEVTENSVTITLEASSDPDGTVEGYNVYVSRDGGTSFVLFETTVELTSTVTGLGSGIEYIFRVNAVDNLDGESDDSNLLTVTTLPATPIALTFDEWTTGDIIDGATKWFSFEAEVGLAYMVSWNDGKEGSGTTVDVAVSAFQADQTTAYFSDLDDGYNIPIQLEATATETVYLAVTSFVAAESGTFEISVASGNSPPAVPADLTVEEVTHDSVLISWLPSTDAEDEVLGYNVYVSEDGGETFVMLDTAVDPASVITGLSPDAQVTPSAPNQADSVDASPNSS